MFQVRAPPGPPKSAARTAATPLIRAALQRNPHRLQADFSRMYNISQATAGRIVNQVVICLIEVFPFHL